MNIENFYKKPETHEELVENMRILKEIPEDITDPKVVIKLGNPEVPHKYVTMADGDKREYVIAMPIERKVNHRDIVELAEKLYEKSFSNISGGYISIEGNKLVIRGSSESFGRADNRHIAEILRKKFPDLEIEAKDVLKYKVKGEEQLPKEVEQIVIDLNEAVILMDRLRDDVNEMKGQYERGEITREELRLKYTRYEVAIHSTERLLPIIQSVLNQMGVEIEKK